MDGICLQSVGSDIPIAFLDDLARKHHWQHRHVASVDALPAHFTPSATDCLLAEMPFPEEAAKPLMDRLRLRSLYAPVVVADGTPSVHRAVAALHAGASDYCEMPFDAQSICDRITRAISRSAGWRALWLARRERLALLTAAEVDVLELLLGAATTKAIAHRLGICTKTVESRRARIFDKLKVNGVNELFKLWLECSEALHPEMKCMNHEGRGSNAESPLEWCEHVS